MFVVSVIQETGSGKDKRTFFHRCGVGFENRDGSVNLKLDLFPGVTLHVREKQENNGNERHDG